MSIDTIRPTCSHSWHRLEIRLSLARLEIRQAVSPSGIHLITQITVGARRDPTTTPLIEPGPPGFFCRSPPSSTVPARATAALTSVPLGCLRAGSAGYHSRSRSNSRVVSLSPRDHLGITANFQVSFLITISMNVLENGD